ncbi:hypothetical protein DENIS_3197 [Desulfonema ishimotonii]|uniref:Uncharacterized protein n=2 Tax=Desulfonema ishimotonii TaxID=45657 RepID=A0A401FZ34_9BACT|nr:hypothetical protein DENIS_3197 [Desulfonema ishimotonii]
MRYLLSGILVIAAATALYFIGLRLFSQVCCLRADHFFAKGQYGLSAGCLEKAVTYQPEDDRLYSRLGEIYFEMVNSASDPEKAVSLLKQATAFYLEAARLNPLDAQVAYGLARCAVLRRNDPGDTDVSQPLAHFERAVRLRPHSIRYNYALARQLHEQKAYARRDAVIQKLVSGWPPAWHYLKKEGFWSDEVRAACVRGLHSALKADNLPRQTCMALSGIMAGENNWSESLAYYQKALGFQAFQNTAGHYIRLAELQLKTGAETAAGETFYRALHMAKTGARKSCFQRVYGLCRRETAWDLFDAVYEKARPLFLYPRDADMLAVRSFMDQKAYVRARALLISVNEGEPVAAAFYWLARIAEIRKKWDEMELASQKATVLAPENSQYHLMFSRALVQLRKLDPAEKAASAAIRCSQKASPWLYHHRARIRWRVQDYPGALEDWLRAIRLRPGHAAFYAQAAEAFQKLGDAKSCVDYYQKAMTADPENARYKKRYAALRPFARE